MNKALYIIIKLVFFSPFDSSIILSVQKFFKLQIASNYHDLRMTVG